MTLFFKNPYKDLLKELATPSNCIQTEQQHQVVISVNTAFAHI